MPLLTAKFLLKSDENIWHSAEKVRTTDEKHRNRHPGFTAVLRRLPPD